MNHKYIKVNCKSEECPHFNKCALIKTNIVIHQPNKPIQYMFVGQGGGEQEEKTHHPFVGPAGIRIRKIIEEIVMPTLLTEFNYAFSNTVRCRPPNNREPNIDEYRACLKYLYRDIEYLNPKMTVALGVPTADVLRCRWSPMGKIHGKKFHIIHFGAKYDLTATYHPSYCVRNGKFECEDDQIVAQDIIDNYVA